MNKTADAIYASNLVFTKLFKIKYFTVGITKLQFDFLINLVYKMLLGSLITQQNYLIYFMESNLGGLILVVIWS